MNLTPRGYRAVGLLGAVAVSLLTWATIALTVWTTR